MWELLNEQNISVANCNLLKLWIEKELKAKPELGISVCTVGCVSTAPFQSESGWNPEDNVSNADSLS